MPIIPEMRDYLDELTAIRRDIHAHPEIGFEEERTADLVAAKLAEWGCEVHRGLATTGAAGPLRRYFSTPGADTEVEHLGLGSARGPVLASELPAPLPDVPMARS